MTTGQRKLVAALVLLVGVPVYALVAAAIVASLPRAPFLLELLIYVVLGVAWALPLKRLFKGIGR